MRLHNDIYCTEFKLILINLILHLNRMTFIVFFLGGGLIAIKLSQCKIVLVLKIGLFIYEKYNFIFYYFDFFMRFM